MLILRFVVVVLFVVCVLLRRVFVFRCLLVFCSCFVSFSSVVCRPLRFVFVLLCVGVAVTHRIHFSQLLQCIAGRAMCIGRTWNN